jgi:anti-sigma factor RsiW
MCLDAGRVLDAYIDNELERADASDLQAHLALCAGCRALLADREEFCRLSRHLPYYPASDHPRWTSENRQFIDRAKPAIISGGRDQ